MTMALAAVAALVAGARLKVEGVRSRVESAVGNVEPSASQPATFTVLGFALLAVLSLLFAFGTPLYAVLFYLLPGYSQLHSAFRWVFPYTLSMAVLAGLWSELLAQRRADPTDAHESSSCWAR